MLYFNHMFTQKGCPASRGCYSLTRARGEGGRGGPGGLNSNVYIASSAHGEGLVYMPYSTLWGAVCLKTSDI